MPIFTLQVAVFPLPSLADTVMILTPSVEAVTVHSNPFGEIETFSLFTDHVTDVLSAFVGNTVAVNVTEPPTSNDTELLFKVILSTNVIAAVTVKLHSA